MAKDQDLPISNAPVPKNKTSFGRWLLAILMCLCAAAYTAGVVLGGVDKDQKIDAPNLVFLALVGICATLLVKPGAVERLRHLKVAGFEVDLEKIKQKQEQQQGQLDAISLLLPLVLREEEGRHLQYLDEKKTAGYDGNQAMRTELRRLRTMGLIENIPYRAIGGMKDGTKFDLADYVRLTPFGCRLVEQLRAIEKAKADKAPQN